MNKEDIVEITKDEYIALLLIKIGQLEQAAISGTECGATFTPRNGFHKWMNHDEKDEIKRLDSIGLRAGEIAIKVGRTRGTVARYIRENLR
ncbi:MAG: helix-turn-helix domain-containing protein [Candidatus Nitrotoga sp.]